MAMTHYTTVLIQTTACYTHPLFTWVRTVHMSVDLAALYMMLTMAHSASWLSVTGGGSAGIT